jgi:apolipoprotein D and lipocalin family protein
MRRPEMKKSTIWFLVLSCVSWFACATTGANMKNPLPVVSKVELSRYLGTWYEIARYPNRFQRDCFGSTATYSLREDGDIKVVNTCRKGSPDGPIDSIEGKAWVVDEATNAKLKVRFFWPFSGNYWIIGLGSDYEYAIVGDPSRDYLWILSRTPTLDDAALQKILDQLPTLGYDPAKLLYASSILSAKP